MPPVAERRLFWATGGGVLLLDLATKLLAEDRLLRAVAVPVVGEWFQLRLVYNPGAAFGLHLGPLSRWIFLGVAVLARMRPHEHAGRGLVKELEPGALEIADRRLERAREPRAHVVDVLPVVAVGQHLIDEALAELRRSEAREHLLGGKVACEVRVSGEEADSQSRA